jgi:CheY-like chemotaxis protein/DNA-binding XRE family transcriptional regulator
MFIVQQKEMQKAGVKAEFAKAVRWWRGQLGLSQEQLAERAGLHRTYISDVERGARNLSLESISKLARALDVSASTLFEKAEQLPGESKAAPFKECVDILLVEDDPNDIELTMAAFRQARFANNVHVVRDGAEALDYIFCRGIHVQRHHEDRTHLMLLDLKLPNMSGIEVLRRIKEDKQARLIPVVILTSSQNSRDMDECRLLGVQTYIVKPLDFHRFSRVTPELNLDWALFKPQPLVRAQRAL